MQTDIKRPPGHRRASLSNAAVTLAPADKPEAASQTMAPGEEAPVPPPLAKAGWFERYFPNKKILITLFSLVGLFGVAFLVLNYSPKTSSPKKSFQLAGINIQNQTETAALKQLKTAAADQKINLLINGTTYSFSDAELGVERDPTVMVETAYTPPVSLLDKLTTKPAPPPIETYVSRARLISALAKRLGQYQTTVDASVSVNNGSLQVNPAKAGITLDFNQIITQLQSSDLRPTITIAAHQTTHDAQISTQAAQTAQQQAAALVAPTYAVAVSGGPAHSASMAQKLNWLVFTPNDGTGTLNVTLNPTAASATMTSLAQGFASTPKDKITLTINGGPPTVLDGGQPGITTDQNSLNSGLAQFQAQLAAHQSYTLPLSVQTQPQAEQDLGTADGGKFVFVDKAAYRAWAIDGSTVDREMVVSTGRAVTPTPSGHYTILWKTRLITMKGCNPAVGCWVVPNVPNAEFFTSNGDALHGTWWHVNWGSQNLSHGCVNLQLADAAWLYDWTSIGTPVIVV